MRKIADKIEYSAPIIYGHFENKEALLLEFTRQGHIRLLELVKESKEKHTDPALQLEAMWMAYWDFAFSNLEYYQLMFGVEMGCCEWQNNEIPEVGEGRLLINEVLETLIKSSKHPEADPCLKFYSLWSIVHGLISINITRKMYDEDSYREGGHGDLNQAVLKDAISGIISRIKE
ncbi:transcriptional regulator, TetR family [Filimonas lacunae]|nr:transcriptional regulator, TetR family [Filimonas lacunae]